ncbi:MAG: LacI family DNA-binding transcriptional regulator [Caldilineaceae bacterium]|nr:LacI family DNA-binding transcriptional regulator [Caldilineaceae bacterium]
MATIYDVARRAQVSTATVSRVLSNQGYVNTATRLRVIRAIEDLKYVPNAMARGLKTKRSGLIALLIPELSNSFFTTIAVGVEHLANANGFSVVLANGDESVDKERLNVEQLVAQRVDGVIVAPVSQSTEHLRPFFERNIPVVIIDRTVEPILTDVVRGDNVGGAIDLTNHLLRLGHRQIAFVNGDPKTSTARERLAGFRIAMERAKIPVAESLVSTGTWWIEDAEARVERLIASGVRFSAIFAANNFMAIGALLALRRHNLRVPEHIALVCFDDVETASQIDPFFTVMAQPPYSMGTYGMKFLLDRISEEYTGPPRDLVLPASLVVRRSCGARLSEPEYDLGILASRI